MGEEGDFVDVAWSEATTDTGVYGRPLGRRP